MVKGTEFPRLGVAQRDPDLMSSSQFFGRLAAFNSEDWRRASGEHLTGLLTRMARSIPAYARFLNSAGDLGSANDAAANLASIPPTSKENYLRTAKFPELLWNGTICQPHVLTSTSGSTGSPTYFARSHDVDYRASLMHELIFHSTSLDPRVPTLVLVCFGMGVWIGGLITYQAFELMGRRGYPLAILTPGINKTEIFKILRDHAPHFEQILIAGYPPFLKDVIDEAERQDVDLKKYRTALLFAAEAFTERFRDHVVTTASVRNALTDTVNIYGSADLGTMAFETALSILARRLALDNEALFADLFGGTQKTPTFAQFVPDFVAFEELDGELLISGDSAMPLMRYAIGDHGGVYSFDAVINTFASHGINLLDAARDAGIEQCVSQLPFVYVYERTDLSTTLFGLQVYPETVREALLDPRFVDVVTGRVTLITKYDPNHDQYLEVNVELKAGQAASAILEAALAQAIVTNLRARNSEFRELNKFLGDRALPRLVFWPYEDPIHFKVGIKQLWVKKSVEPDSAPE